MYSNSHPWMRMVSEASPYSSHQNSPLPSYMPSPPTPGPSRRSSTPYEEQDGDTDMPPPPPPIVANTSRHSSHAYTSRNMHNSPMTTSMFAIQNASPQELLLNPFHRMLQENYDRLAFAFDQFRTFQPVHFQQQPPASPLFDLSLLQPLRRSDYKSVKFWTPDAFRSQNGDEDDFAVFAGDEDDDNNTKAMSKKLRFLENEKGLPVASDRILLARRTARSVFHSALQKGIAPRCFTEGTAEFLQQLRVTMYGAVPELRLCENHWKVDKLCGVIYSDWVRTRREQVVPAQNTKKRKRTSKDDANDHRRRPKHRQSPAPPPLDLDTLIPLSSHDHGFPKSLSPERTVPSPLDLDLPLFPDSPTDTRQPPDEAPADPLPPTPNGSPVLPQSLQFDIQNPLADLFGAGDDGPETPAPPTPSGLPTSSKPATASSTPATPSLLPPAPAPQATQPTQPKGRASGNSTKHVPGAANTAWNLFGRMYMAQPANKNKTTAEVKQVWDKEMNVEARKPYMDQAQTYKDAEKARKEAEKAAGNAPTKGKGKAKAKGKGTDSQ